MKDRDQDKLRILLDNLTGFIETKVEIIKYDIKEDFSKAALSIVLILLSALLVLLFIVLSSVGLSIYVNQLIGSAYMGYLIVASGYLTLLFILILLYRNNRIRDRLQQFIFNLLRREDHETGN